MKKIVLLSLVLSLFTFSADAQLRPYRTRTSPLSRSTITLREAMNMRRDHQRYKMARFRAQRDGVITPVEKRKLRKMKRHERRQFFWYRHNGNRRIL